ncbi:MAG: hypothetical protein U0790_27050 [Isosphaeraceae bacterium]
MSTTSPAARAQESHEPAPPARVDAPYRNPTYPARTHWSERAGLEDRLKAWDQKIGDYARRLATLRDSASRASFERIYHQMTGARDQFADAARRLPRETGALYHEDLERLENAESALQRLVQRWDRAKA